MKGRRDSCVGWSLATASAVITSHYELQSWNMEQVTIYATWSHCFEGCFKIIAKRYCPRDNHHFHIHYIHRSERCCLALILLRWIENETTNFNSIPSLSHSFRHREKWRIRDMPTLLSREWQWIFCNFFVPRKQRVIPCFRNLEVNL